ncbi:ABC transporter ATP-binding protein, partial [Streptomyces sp. NPDC005962]
MAEQTLEPIEPAVPSVPAEARVPTVIADDVHIVYRVNGGPKGRGSATAAL